VDLAGLLDGFEGDRLDPMHAVRSLLGPTPGSSFQPAAAGPSTSSATPASPTLLPPPVSPGLRPPLATD